MSIERIAAVNLRAALIAAAAAAHDDAEADRG